MSALRSTTVRYVLQILPRNFLWRVYGQKRLRTATNRDLLGEFWSSENKLEEN